VPACLPACESTWSTLANTYWHQCHSCHLLTHSCHSLTHLPCSRSESTWSTLANTYYDAVALLLDVAAQLRGRRAFMADEALQARLRRLRGKAARWAGQPAGRGLRVVQLHGCRWRGLRGAGQRLRCGGGACHGAATGRASAAACSLWPAADTKCPPTQPPTQQLPRTTNANPSVPPLQVPGHRHPGGLRGRRQGCAEGAAGPPGG
jgi:hypothetical protein